MGLCWLLFLMISGCTDDLGIVGNRQVDYLCFTATLGGDSLSHSSRGTTDYMSYEVEDWSLVDDTQTSFGSRGVPVSRLDGSAGIIGYTKGTGTDADWTLWENVLNHQEFKFAGDELSTTGDPIYWNTVPAGNLLLNVYAPKTINGVVFSGQSTSFTYTVPTAVSDQTDILVARTEVPSNYRSSIPLAFEHALTAVKFNIGFNCTVKSLKIEGLKNSGTYTFGEGWSERSGNAAYEFTFGGESDTNISLGAGERFKVLTDGENTLMMIPQELNGAKVTLTYDDNETIVATLKDKEWKSGKMVTYTIYKERPDIVYFDLAAGNIEINNTGYSGFVYVNGTAKPVEGAYAETNLYYVYQSSEQENGYNKIHTGYATQTDYDNKTNCRIPAYPRVTYKSQLWSDFITNNTSVEDVIEIWDDGQNIRTDGSMAPDENHVGTAVVRDAGRTHTRNYIKVTGSNAKYNLTIDNIYSVIQQPVDNTQAFRKRSLGGIAYIPSGNTDLIVNLVGDNRMGCLHIDNYSTDKITIQGTGSLTAADTDFLTVKCVGDYKSDFGDTKGYISNFWNSAIGNNTDDSEGEHVYNLYIASGVIFAGATKTEDCTAIGGGGNGFGQVYITGGVVTAVATTAGTAIGGGMGHTAHGGEGDVHITGGNIYAYNFANQWGISSSAIGGGGSANALGSNGAVEITGGYVYAYSALGTAIGGGSSLNTNGGNATVKITGGYVIAKSGKSNGIGGGMGGTSSGSNGGSANIRISGNPIIRTGSIGGGKTQNTTGTIGTADIAVSGGDTQAQFVMAAGAGIKPTFTMTGGTVRNSDTSDKEYYHVQPHGGAVYLEDGTFKMSAGEIVNCSAIRGGAVYIKGDASTTFTMSGGQIYDCMAIKNPSSSIDPHGGAVYLEGGKVSLSGGSISDNLANGGYGGGIYITDGNFEMTGEYTQLLGNSAIYRDGKGGHGGALYVTSSNNAQVSVLSGTISENSSDRLGGGICVDMGSSDKTAEVTIGQTGSGNLPSIISNHTILSGGGLFVRGSKANVTIKGGKIVGNTTSAYVVNENVANEKGMVSLEDENVTTHVTVTFNGNGGTTEGNAELSTQHIVTATNSLLVTPTFTRAGYKFIGWNTRADGYGDGDYNDGKVMNIQTDLTLYAQWKIN